MLPASSAMSATRRIARSRISSGYFFGAGMTPPFRGFGVSINPGAIQLVVAQPDAEVLPWVRYLRQHGGVGHDRPGVGAVGGVNPPAGGPGAEDGAVVAAVG